MSTTELNKKADLEIGLQSMDLNMESKKKFTIRKLRSMETASRNFCGANLNGLSL